MRSMVGNAPGAGTRPTQVRGKGGVRSRLGDWALAGSSFLASALLLVLPSRVNSRPDAVHQGPPPALLTALLNSAENLERRLSCSRGRAHEQGKRRRSFTQISG